MKLSTLIYSSILSLALPITLQAQLKCPPLTGSSDGKIDITFGAGPTLLYGDINHKSNMGYGVYLKGDYNVYKALYVGLEGQFGKLKAKGVKDLTATDWDPRDANNGYFAGLLNVTLYPYRLLVSDRELARKGFFERNILNGFHIGVGAGFVFNNYKFDSNDRRSATEFIDNEGNYNRIPEGDNNGPHELAYGQLNPDGTPDADSAYKLFKRSTKSTLFPVLHVGLSVPLNKNSSYDGRFFSAVIRSEFNFATNDDLDGYDPLGPDGIRRAEAKNDMYNFSSLGIKYTF